MLYDELYEIAADNHGIVTSAQAKEAGATDRSLCGMVASGRLARLGRGVYRVRHHVPGPADPYAEAVALAGEGAYLYGESVLAMLGLAPTDPSAIWVATPRRVRRDLPAGLRVVRRKGGGDETVYDGVASQTAEGAIRSMEGLIPRDRLAEAVRRASEEGYLLPQAARSLEKEVLGR